MSDLLFGDTQIKTDQIKGSSGELKFILNKQPLAENAEFSEDVSHVVLSQTDGASIKLAAGGKMRLDAPTTLSVNSNENYFESVLGDKQIKVGRDVWSYIEGDTHIRIGSQSSSEREAYKKLQELAENIQNKAIDKAKGASESMVPCPVCSTMLVEDQNIAHLILNKVSYALEDVPYMGPFLKFAAILKRLTAGMRTKIPASANHSKTKSCGNPECKNHKIPNIEKSLDTHASEVVNGLSSNEQTINDLHKQVGKGGGLLLTTKAGIVINAGLYKNTSKVYFNKGRHPIRASMVNPGNGGSLTPSGRGAPERSIETSAVQLAEGDMYLNVSDRFTVNAGSPGIHLETSGPTRIASGGVQIHSTEGETQIGSANVVVINGKMISIESDDKSGDGSIQLKAQNVMVDKSLGVGANLAVKGEISCDGPLTVPFLNTLTQSQDVTITKTTQMCTGGQNTGPVGTVMRTASFAKDMVGKYILPPTTLLNIDMMYAMMEEIYDTTMSAVFSFIPEFIISGWCLVTVFSTGIGIGGCTLGGAVFTNVVTYGYGLGGLAPVFFCPVFSMYHNHDMFSMEHGGSVTIPLMNGYDDVSSLNKQRYGMSPTPAIAPSIGNTGERPGRRGNPAGCIKFPGGGGGNPYNKARNLQHGLDPNNPWGDFNFINRYTSTRNLSTNNDGFIPYTTPEPSLWTHGYKSLSADQICADNCPVPSFI